MKRPYAITMGTFQMAILLCLNNSASVSIKDIQESTQLPEKELIKQVQSLIESKLLIIQSETAQKTGDEPNTTKVMQKT